MLGDFTPDAALPEALLFLRLRDTTAAIRILESTLASARAYAPLSPEGAPNNVALAGSLANTIALRAQLTASDPAAAHRWGQAALALWSGADPSLQPRLRALADSGRP
jgi:hypothetical protein